MASRLYFNAIQSADANSPVAGTDLVYSSQFPQPILNKCSDYYLAITRFQLPSSQIPLMVCPVRVGGVDGNQTPFLITLNYAGVDYAAYVTYTPDINGGSAPPAPGAVSTAPSSEYYYIYSVNTFLNCVNACIDSIMTDIRTATGITTESPYFVWDPRAQILGFVCAYAFFNPDSIVLSVNNALYKYFEFFRWQLNTSPADVAAGKDYSLVITDSVMNWWALPSDTVTNPPAYLQIDEEFSTSVTNWFAVKSVVVTTDTVPVAQEYTPIVGASNSGVAGIATRAVITDFIPNFQQIIEARGTYSYNQVGPYRVTPMVFDLPLSRFDLRVFWTDANGNYIPWQLGPGESANFKIAFIRKDSFTG